MNAWLRQHQAKLQFALRMTLAALASYGLGEALGLAQTYWAVLSAVIVIQGSVGGSVRAGINRLIGTVGGAFWGAGVAILIRHESPGALALALMAAVAPLAIMTAFRPDYRVAPITAIIVLMGTVLQQSDPVESAVSRVFEISLGSAIAIAVALFILPARAHSLLARAGGSVVASMADMVHHLEGRVGQGVGAEALLGLQNRVRIGIAQTEIRAAEARVERTNRLSDGPDPEPLARTLRRLRHDLAMLARALKTPFSDPVRDRLEAPLAALFKALSYWLGATSKALSAEQLSPDLKWVQIAVDEYKAAVARAGQEGLTYEAGKDDMQRVFALLFLFEQMLQNLQDLADRTAELAGSRKADGETDRMLEKGGVAA
jgi:uncharacterized membrane protein YccC